MVVLFLNFSLQVEVEEQPEQPVFKWYRNDVEIENTEKTKISMKRHISILNITNVQPADSGKYVCAVQNSTGVVRSTCTINIIGKLLIQTYKIPKSSRCK